MRNSDSAQNGTLRTKNRMPVLADDPTRAIARSCARSLCRPRDKRSSRRCEVIPPIRAPAPLSREGVEKGWRGEVEPYPELGEGGATRSEIALVKRHPP